MRPMRARRPCFQSIGGDPRGGAVSRVEASHGEGGCLCRDGHRSVVGRYEEGKDFPLTMQNLHKVRVCPPSKDRDLMLSSEVKWENSFNSANLSTLRSATETHLGAPGRRRRGTGAPQCGPRSGVPSQWQPHCFVKRTHYGMENSEKEATASRSNNHRTFLCCPRLPQHLPPLPSQSRQPVYVEL